MTNPALTQHDADSAADHRAFRQFLVVAKTRESELITSFLLEPVTDIPLPDWKAGQYLCSN